MAEGRVFVLHPYNRNRQDFKPQIVITPQNTPQQKVMAAWSYAIRYTATGIDLPDYEKAIALMQERHPSWDVIQSSAITTQVNLQLAEQDEPEST